uniref:nucleotidyl transferase AbiEii/AbiGii toxin family protein n=1 Tax=uncultured Eubacterium sp. TaxID=165185 RepID=UPI00259892BD
MINNATQLKAKVRNVSNGNDNIAKSYIRIFFMERFMERLSLSKYKDNFVIKGGMLVSSLLGIDLRSTMDIDTSVYSLTLSIDD